MDGAVARDGVTDDLVKEAKDFADAAYQKDRVNREKALVDLQMLAGDQWSSRDRQDRENLGRPVLTVNRLIQPVKLVSNSIRQATPSVKVGPVDNEGDNGLAAIYAGLIRQIQRTSRATWVYGNAAGHAAACGIGHFRIKTAYVDDDIFDQEIRVELIRHPLAVLWDPGAVEPDRSDANSCMVFEFVPRGDWEKRFPDAAKTQFDMPETMNGGSFQWYAKDHVVVAEYWRKVPVKKRLGLLDTGEVIDLTDVAQLEPGKNVVREREALSHKLEQVLLSGSERLTEVSDWPGKWIPIIPVIGSEIPLEQEIVRHGLVRHAVDSQRMYNYWRSSAAEWIQQGPKAPFLTTPEEIGPFKDLWDSANTTPRPYLLYNRDPANPQAKPYREQPPQPPQAFWQEGQMTADEIKATTGLFDASLGARSNEVSGKAILARQAEGEVSNFEYADNLGISVQHAGRVMVDLIPKIYDTERIVRILDEEEREQFVPINQTAMGDRGKPVLVNDLTVGKYDITITIGQSQLTRRLEAADSMFEFVKVMPETAALVMPELIEAMDWPGKDKISRRLQEAQQPPPPDPKEETAKNLELEGMAAKNEQTKADAALKLSKANTEQIDAAMTALTGGKPGERMGKAANKSNGASK